MMNNTTSARAALVYPSVGSKDVGERLVGEAVVYSVGLAVERNVISAPSTWEAVARINDLIEDLVGELSATLAGVDEDNFANVQHSLLPVIYEEVKKLAN